MKSKKRGKRSLRGSFAGDRRYVPGKVMTYDLLGR